MKVLWITNVIFPDACEQLGIEAPVIGGWMYAGAQALLAQNKEITFGVAAMYNGRELKQFIVNGITYFLLPAGKSSSKYDNALEASWQKIKETFAPDLVHIHGSEYPHGLAYVRACGKENVVVSVQGLVSVYERYYYGGIEEQELSRNITLRDRIKWDTIYGQRANMKARGASERLLLQSVDHVIGRTTWDKHHIASISPQASYHFCNETLRGNFYSFSWDRENCEGHSIFLSQAHYPIKGLHQVIKAMPYVLRKFPQTKVHVAGSDFFTNKGYKLSGYGKYILSLLKVNNLSAHFQFTGKLSEQEMTQRFLKAQVFVCPSSIENSPNSIGEAQLLGVPCVASYVGGMADMIIDNESGLLYRFEEIEMLAEKIIQLFEDQKLSEDISRKSREIAHLRHDKTTNARQLYNIYKSICNKH